MFYKNYFASFWQDSDEHHFSLKLPSSCDIGFLVCVFSLLICSILLFFFLYTKAGKRLAGPTVSCFMISDHERAVAAAAAAKLLQSCPTLCNHIDSSSPCSPIPGILQARTLEWVKRSLAFPILLFSSIFLH